MQRTKRWWDQANNVASFAMCSFDFIPQSGFYLFGRSQGSSRTVVQYSFWAEWRVQYKSASNLRFASEKTFIENLVVCLFENFVCLKVKSAILKLIHSFQAIQLLALKTQHCCWIKGQALLLSLGCKIIWRRVETFLKLTWHYAPYPSFVSGYFPQSPTKLSSSSKTLTTRFTIQI